jgi:CheY-like chemotaxis protein
MDGCSYCCSSKPIQILMAEDNAADVFLVRAALDARGFDYELHHAEDGEKVLQFIQAAEEDETPPPALLLLDLNLPKRRGDDVLRRVRQSRRCADMPVIVLTSSDSPKDRERAATLGATQYLRKPSDYDAFMSLGQAIEELLRQQAS